MRQIATLILLTVIAVAVFVTAAVTASAVELEPGATFYDNGTCHEADGTWGLPEASGQCVTPADYDKLFSFEALSQVENPSSGPGVSVAEAYGITDDGVKASERRRVFMGVDQGSFSEVVVRLVGGQVAT